ncbi:hypothetical protein [Streptomyces sp. NPDC002133]|uniref:hypothetical protein n=1 Tax=Streptomyces sp. NPDC002133 TaxID=3154409 RepID=UPI0033280747
MPQFANGERRCVRLKGWTLDCWVAVPGDPPTAVPDETRHVGPANSSSLHAGCSSVPIS